MNKLESVLRQRAQFFDSFKREQARITKSIYLLTATVAGLTRQLDDLPRENNGSGCQLCQETVNYETTKDQ